jgi:tricorn protease
VRRLALFLFLFSLGLHAQGEEIRLANGLALSPDGSTIAFSWNGEVWTVPSSGGVAQPLTRNAGRDREPEFSPDGKQIAFVSNREGSDQVYIVSSKGGIPRQVTHHTGGYSLQGWTGDGRNLLVSASRDHGWRGLERFFKVSTTEPKADELLFDAYGANGSLSPDGKKLLFTREGAPWFRKGYVGSEDSQIWLYNLETKVFQKVLNPDGGALTPLWKPDGNGFYYVGIVGKSLNLIEHDLATSKSKPITKLEDDTVMYPSLSHDGSLLVFRHLFDVYSVNPTKPEVPPKKLEIRTEGDLTRDPIERRVLTQATQVAFTKDGLVVAFIAGGDLWVMDTELLEPKQVTSTPEEERSPVFAPDSLSICFVSDKSGQSDLYRADRADGTKDWWQNTKFNLTQLTNDADVESDLQWSPEGSKLAFLKSRGDLWTINADGKDARKVLGSWNSPEYDWSPDGKWFVYARSDEDFNQDIWIIPSDGSKPPFNLSRHPDNESNPVWSPDGKMIAFTGRRIDTEVDLHYVWLRAADDEKTSRERSVEKAVDKVKKARTKPATKGVERNNNADKPAKSPVVIDFEDIHKRIHQVSIPNTSEQNLVWSPDSKKLAFTASIEGKSGLYSIDIPEDTKPKLISATTGTQARWLDAGNQIVWLSGSVPASLVPGGKESSYRFRAFQEVDLPAKYRAVFELCWRTMRDRWYDERLGNRNWDAIRRKYTDMAAASPDIETLTIVIQLMLGELNGSHLGFMPGPAPAEPGAPPRLGRGGGAGSSDSGPRWSVVTPHLGLRFDPAHKGPGLKVKDVIPDGPAARTASLIKAGETIIAIDGTTVDPSMDLTKILNGRLDRDIKLTVRGTGDKDREVIIRPIAYSSVPNLLYEKWINDNRKLVDTASKGTLGYLHIRAMSMPSFYRFEEELYSAGAGKQGLIIDVRENGGGSTADHLLTALTQPNHAITVGRGGGPGYPQDRKIYATWNKPIVVLCNQNSFSNAEIFSHAIKTLKRGKLVGVTTAGGVVSTGATSIMDVGTLRLPSRGWYLPDNGEDMELHGAVPDFVIWPEPSDQAKGIDRQLEKAIEVLGAEVTAEAQKPRPKLRKATER